MIYSPFPNVSTPHLPDEKFTISWTCRGWIFSSTWRRGSFVVWLGRFYATREHMNRDEGGLFVFPAAGYQENSGASTFFSTVYKQHSVSHTVFGVRLQPRAHLGSGSVCAATICRWVKYKPKYSLTKITCYSNNSSGTAVPKREGPGFHWNSNVVCNIFHAQFHLRGRQWISEIKQNVMRGVGRKYKSLVHTPLQINEILFRIENKQWLVIILRLS